jgi:alpha-N-acetylglucosaminidase
MLPQIKAAYDAKDTARLAKGSRDWLSLMDLLDELVATDSRHLLGRWVADARSWAVGSTERAELAYDALSLLTVWGTREGADAGLRDYANREWAGLVGGLYRLRWATYFEELRAALAEGRAPKKIDWFALEDRWARNPGTLATEPAGDTYAVAARVRDRLAALA